MTKGRRNGKRKNVVCKIFLIPLSSSSTLTSNIWCSLLWWFQLSMGDLGTYPRGYRGPTLNMNCYQHVPFKIYLCLVCFCNVNVILCLESSSVWLLVDMFHLCCRDVWLQCRAGLKCHLAWAI